MNKYILPVCLLIIFLTQIYNYAMGFRVEMAMFVVILLLLPSAIKGLK